jgi:hypothetical protein
MAILILLTGIVVAGLFVYLTAALFGAEHL